MTNAGAAYAAAAVLLALGVLEAAAQDKAIKSRFTAIDLGSCDRIEAATKGAAWSCSGLPDFPVFFAEVGPRQIISFGPDPQRRRAARQTLDVPNNALDAQRRATVEWRFDRRAGRDVPYAAIVRYRTERDGVKGEVLVVTRIGENDSCHAAYIDALANPEAMALARTWADSEAPKLDCSGKPRIVGNRGKSPM